MNVRAKLTVEEVDLFENSEIVKMRAVYDSNTPEDNTYSKYTPSATLQMSVTNPSLFGYFRPGKKYYLDFVPMDIG